MAAKRRVRAPRRPAAARRARRAVLPLLALLPRGVNFVSIMRPDNHLVAAEDAADVYHRAFKFVALPALVAYIVHAAALSSGHRDNSRYDRVGYVSTSGDVGLLMALSERMPPWLLWTHGRGALTLVALVLVQKELVRKMGLAPSFASFSYFSAAHRKLGYAILAALLVMDACGYALCKYSTFEGFQWFAVVFAAPFAAWLIGIWCTARAGYWRSHALLANMLLKGCIATPLSRLGGAYLQHHGWPMASGYYQGIFAVAAIIAVWQAVDLVGWQSPPSRPPHFLARTRSKNRQELQRYWAAEH